MDEGVFHEEQLDNYTATSELCEDEGHKIRHEQTIVQGRCAGNQGGQRSVGFMFLRYAAV